MKKVFIVTVIFIATFLTSCTDVSTELEEINEKERQIELQLVDPNNDGKIKDIDPEDDGE